MSYLNINPANAPVIATISGNQVVAISGSTAVVAIAASPGGTTLVDVQSSVGSDDVGTGTDALVTQSLNYGFHSGNNQWARIGAQIMASGGGFGLQTSTVIRDHNIPNNKARVLNNTAYAAIATVDDALLTVSQALGYDQTVSGYQALQVTSSGKGISGNQHRVIVDFSGAIAQIGASGSTRTVAVNRYGFDDGSINDNRLLTNAALWAYDQDQNNVARLRVTASGLANSMSGVQMKLAVALSGDPVSISGNTVQIGEGGDIVNVQNNTTDNISINDNALTTMALNYGFHEESGVTSGWNRLRLVTPLSGGDAIGPFSGFALATATLIVDAGGRIANLGLPNTDTSSVDDPALDTRSRMHGFNGDQNEWVRLRTIAVDRGQTQISGYIMPTSGFFLGTTSVIIDDDGTIADIDQPNSDVQNPNVPALSTIGYLHGYHFETSEWSRIGAIVPSSGAGYHLLTTHASGVSNRVEIVEGNNIVDVGTAMSDTMSNSDNELVTRAYLAGYDRTVDTWRRADARGGGHESGFALMVSDTATAGNIDISRVTVTGLSGGQALSNINVIGKLIIQNESGNNAMNIAGNNAGDFPSSSNGLQLFGGEKIELKVKNANVLSIMAMTSGQRIRLYVEN